MLSLTSVSLFLVLAAQAASPTAGQNPTPFTRVYKAKEKVSYQLDLNLKDLGSVHAVIQLSVLKMLPKNVPQILLKTTECKVTPESSKSIMPDDQTCIFTAHNVPDKLKITLANFVYMLLIAAGPTPDKVVKVGDEVVQNLDFSDDRTTLKGKGKFASVDTTKRTATVDWKYSLTMGTEDVGALTFTSVYDQTNYSLVKSTGQLNGPGNTVMTIALTRVEPGKPAK